MKQFDVYRLRPSRGEGAGRLVVILRATMGQRVGNVAPHRDEIVSALDLLFTGY